MLNTEQIEILSELPAPYRHAAAELYYEAFQRDLARLVVSPEQGVALVEGMINSPYAMIALYQGKCVGLAGVQYEKHSFIQLRRAHFVQTLGRVRGLLGYLAFRYFEASVQNDELRIDSLAVTPALRGQGLGTRLLAAVYAYAQAKGFKTLSLEVVDTNPHARRLYERLGFVPVRTRHYPYLRHVAGFSAETIMIKKINSETPATQDG